MALARLAWIRQAAGDTAGATEAMAEAERAAPGPEVSGLINTVPAQLAWLRLVQGDVAAAARWADQRGLKAGDEPAYHREREHLVLARVLLAQDRPHEALTLLDRLLAHATAQHRTRSAMEIQALRALALAAQGQDTTAAATLAEALIAACPQRHVRIFADEGPPMRALLGRLVSAHRAGRRRSVRDLPLGYLAQLMLAFGAEPAAPGPPPVPGLIDPLTGRELEVLALLAAGQPNQAIAGELFVTVDTVKKHVSHILAKLGAANRGQAVAEARDLGLIP